MFAKWMAAILLAWPLAVAAADVDVTATTLVHGRQDPRDGAVHTVVPTTVAVSLLATELEVPLLEGVRVVVSGWGGMFPGEPRDGQAASGDLDLGYVEGGILHGRLTLRAGRQRVVGGAARSSQLDGMTAAVGLGRGFGLAAYGGAPVAPRFGVARGDAMAGARAFWRPTPDTELGASFVQLLERGLTARQDVAIDARMAPAHKWTFGAYALASVKEWRMAEVELIATHQPNSSVLLSADYRRISPDLYISRASIFSVFSEETRDEVGGEAFYQPQSRLSLNADYHALVIPEGWGHRLGGGTKLRLTRQASVGAELRTLQLRSNGYLQIRVYARCQITAGMVATIDGDSYFFKQTVNGQSASHTASATFGYDFARDWHALVAVIAGQTPYLERRLEAIAKVIYSPTWRMQARSP